MTATKERDLKHELTAAVPGSLAIRAAGSMGDGDLWWSIPARPVVIIEVKATADTNFHTSDNQRVKDQWDQYSGLSVRGHEVHYAIWFKRDGWRFYDVGEVRQQAFDECAYPVLKRDAGVSFQAFVSRFQPPIHEGTEHDGNRS